jgi:rod shape-determining protein MreD
MAFGLICFALILWRLVPGNLVVNPVPWPDVMFALTLAFSMRRPDLIPYWLVGGIFLLADILLQRPIGLWAAIVLISAEFARSHSWRYRDVSFLADWLFTAFIILGATLLNRVAIGFVLIEQGGIAKTLLVALMTALIYPAVVFLCFAGLGIGKQETIEARRKGRFG